MCVCVKYDDCFTEKMDFGVDGVENTKMGL